MAERDRVARSRSVPPLDSENPCCTFTAAVPVEQRARRADIPGEPVTEGDSLFRREFQLGTQHYLLLYWAVAVVSSRGMRERDLVLHLGCTLFGPPLYSLARETVCCDWGGGPRVSR